MWKFQVEEGYLTLEVQTMVFTSPPCHASVQGLTSPTNGRILCGCLLHVAWLSWIPSNNRMFQRSIHNALFVSLRLWISCGFRTFLPIWPGIIIINGSFWGQCLGIFPGTHCNINLWKRRDTPRKDVTKHIIRLWGKGYMMSCTLKETVYCSSCKLLNIYIFSKHCIIKGWKGWLDFECCVCLFCFVFLWPGPYEC